jgi:hypothetical protein
MEAVQEEIAVQQVEEAVELEVEQVTLETVENTLIR